MYRRHSCACLHRFAHTCAVCHKRLKCTRCPCAFQESARPIVFYHLAEYHLVAVDRQDGRAKSSARRELGSTGAALMALIVTSTTASGTFARDCTPQTRIVSDIETYPLRWPCTCERTLRRNLEQVRQKVCSHSNFDRNLNNHARRRHRYFSSDFQKCSVTINRRI